MIVARKFRLLGAGLLAIASVSHAADLNNGIDVLSPSYARSTELISQSDQMLASVEMKTKQACELQSYPGFDCELALELLGAIRDDFSIILTPERRRMEFQTIVPDGAFVISDQP